jgi:hypothetical protein
MIRSAAWSATWLVCIVLSACGDKSSPTAPSSPPTSFNGQWSGTTSQGQSISFSVASDRVTTVSVGYNYSGCSGTATATNLNLEITDLRGTPFESPEPFGFFSLLGPYSESDNTQFTAWFKSPSERTGRGYVLFVRPQCGESFAFWTVTKR